MANEKEIIRNYMSHLKTTKFIKKDLGESLKDIGFSKKFVDELVKDLPNLYIKSFKEKYGKELDDVHKVGFFNEKVPKYFERWVLPELNKKKKIIDVGCGNGVLAKILNKKMVGKKLTGIDINQYPEWSEISNKNIKFKVVKEKDFSNFLSKENPEEIILTWTLHHMKYLEQLRYLKQIYNLIKKGTRIIILEDSFSTSMLPLLGKRKYKAFSKFSPKERKKIMAIYDWVANRILAKREKVPMPFSYRDLEMWVSLTEKIGFTTITKRFIGFPDNRDINTPQSLLIIEK